MKREGCAFSLMALAANGITKKNLFSFFLQGRGKPLNVSEHHIHSSFCRTRDTRTRLMEGESCFTLKTSPLIVSFALNNSRLQIPFEYMFVLLLNVCRIKNKTCQPGKIGQPPEPQDGGLCRFQSLGGEKRSSVQGHSAAGRSALQSQE